MTQYSPIVLDHFQNPRNIGDLATPDAVGVSENPICGDTLRIEMQLSSDTIVAVRWRGGGCVPSLAAASLVSEMLTGRDVSGALAIDADTLSEALGGVPPSKTHALSLVIDTIAAALHDHSPAVNSGSQRPQQ